MLGERRNPLGWALVALLVACAVAKSDDGRPVITLDLEEAQQLYKLESERAGVPCNGLNAPSPPSNPSDPRYKLCRPRQMTDAQETHVVKCNVGPDPCKIPKVQAYDHHDGALPISRLIYLVNEDGNEVPKEVQPIQYQDINWEMRAEYLVKFSARDTAGNEAEKLFLAVVMEDVVPPTIQTTMVPDEVESCDSDDPHFVVGSDDGGSVWEYGVPSTYATAHDNIDGDVSKTITAVPSTFDTRVLGPLTITFHANDYAGMFGLHGEDNVGTKDFNMTVVDTTPPLIYCKPHGTKLVTDTDIKDGIASSATLASVHDIANVDDCAAQCELQQWQRRVGSKHAEAMCGSVEYDADLSICFLKEFSAAVIDELKMGERGSWENTNVGSHTIRLKYAYTESCQVKNAVECDRTQKGYTDIGARCIDFHDSLNIDLPPPHIDDTALASRTTSIGKGEFLKCVPGPYEHFVLPHSNHDLDNMTLSFTPCQTRSTVDYGKEGVHSFETDAHTWDFRSERASAPLLADANCKTCGVRLGLGDDDCVSVPIQEFHFFGDSFNNVFVCSNGAIYFGAVLAKGTAGSWSIEQFMSAKMVAALWRDLHPTSDKHDHEDAYHETVGELEKFRWHEITGFPDGGKNTFMIVLNTTENSVRVVFNKIESKDGIVGISSGTKDPNDHFRVDFDLNQPITEMPAAMHHVGDFEVEYKCSDMQGLEATNTRTVNIVDTTKPKLNVSQHMVEFATWQSEDEFRHLVGVESVMCVDSCEQKTHIRMYVYEGFCSGEHECLDENGEVKICNPAIDAPETNVSAAAANAGQYAIKYLCHDSSGNAAVPQCRTVINQQEHKCILSDWTETAVDPSSAFMDFAHPVYRTRTIMNDKNDTLYDPAACGHTAEYYDQIPGENAGIFIGGYAVDEVTEELKEEWLQMIRSQLVSKSRTGGASGEKASPDGELATPQGDRSDGCTEDCEGWNIEFLEAPKPAYARVDDSGVAVEAFNAKNQPVGIDLLVGARLITAEPPGDPPSIPMVLLINSELRVRVKGYHGEISGGTLSDLEHKFAGEMANAGIHDVNANVNFDSVKGDTVISLHFPAGGDDLHRSVRAEDMEVVRAVVVAAVPAQHEVIWPDHLRINDTDIMLGRAKDCAWNPYQFSTCPDKEPCLPIAGIETRTRNSTERFGGQFCTGASTRAIACPTATMDCNCWTTYSPWQGCPLCDPTPGYDPMMNSSTYIESRQGVDKHTEWHEGCPLEVSRPCTGIPACTDEPTSSPTSFPTAFVEPCSTPVITLAGEDVFSIDAAKTYNCESACNCSPLTLGAENHYVEPGVSCRNALVSKINTTSKWMTPGNKPPDTNQLGAYEIEYSCELETDCGLLKAVPLTRTVLVLYTDFPKCHLFGEPVTTVEADFPYIDDGACMYDDYQGLIADSNRSEAESSFTVTSPVDVHTVGDYVVSYTVDNPQKAYSVWDKRHCVRTVKVVDTLKPVISMVHNGVFMQPDQTPDISSSRQPFVNPAHHFVANPGSRKAIDYDTKTELGSAPYLFEDKVASYTLCQQKCEEDPKCLYGTFITEEPRKGECWLSGTTSRFSRSCGMGCRSFIVTDDRGNSQFRRRLMGVVGMVAGSERAAGASIVAVVAGLALVSLVVAALKLSRRSSIRRVAEPWADY